MGFHLSFTLIFLSSAILQALEINSGRALDLVIRDYTSRSYSSSLRTGEVHKIHLPANLSGVQVDMIRLRCGSLQRYGAKLDEFSLASGVNVSPCSTRVLLVRQRVSSNWSSLYYNAFELSGYRLISPVLALVAYAIQGTNISTTQPQIQASRKGITVDFSSTLPNKTSSTTPLCANFNHDGRVSLSNQERDNVCVATGSGRVGLVVEAEALKGKVGKGKIVGVSCVGAALGAFLLSLLGIAMMVKAKKKERMDEMERRAYEDEALQVSMVGHVRAVTASATRTAPVIEHRDCRLPS